MYLRKKLKSEKGITLIALVITIVVLIILAAITINIVINGGIFNTAKEARLFQANAIEYDYEKTEEAANYIAELTGNGTNTYPDDWVIAWAYNGTSWSNPYTRENGLLDSYFEDIDNNYSISDVTDLKDANILILLYEKNNSEYSMIICGSGKLVHVDEYNNGPCSGMYMKNCGNNEFYWVDDFEFKSDFLDKVTTLEIKEGITEISDEFFGCLNGLRYAYIPNTVTSIGDRAFVCENLTEVEFGKDFNGEFECVEKSNDKDVSFCFLYTKWLENIRNNNPASYTYDGYLGIVTVEINGTPWNFVQWWDI